METDYIKGEYDAVVVGAGHAGCEAALACARTGLNTALLTLNLDNVAFMACNPSIGGTAKGHLVRELDALGGEMGVLIDKTMLQIRMLNLGKGAAVHSLRAQADKNVYHTQMKKTLENTPNLHVLQCEAQEILTENGHVTGVKTTFGGTLKAKTVILCTGVYLNSHILAGEWLQKSGPSGFAPATCLTRSLANLGFKIRRFKTGTPARIDKRTIDFSKCEIQEGEKHVYPFSFMSERVPEKQTPCYLTYTNTKTHDIIRANLHRSPLYNGTVIGTGPRYCPSIETKVERFKDKERHQIFLEPEGADTNEIYVQGMSTSLPHDVQEQIYHSVAGLEHCEIMRYAYAIEYDCIDSLDLLPTLEYKNVKGLYCAGQINGTSGYEEAAAQGLMAGLNASLAVRGKPPVILRRDQAYIGVLIDDLVTKGTNEPYRMMTSRAEHRIFLRQDNADFRLTEIGREAGLVTDERYDVFNRKKQQKTDLYKRLEQVLPEEKTRELVLKYCDNPPKGGLKIRELITRNIPIEEIKQAFGFFDDLPWDLLDSVETEIRYSGYLEKENREIEKAKKLEQKVLPEDIDYSKIEGLRLEAKEKLNKIRPLNLGQAARISGVNPADVAVLMVYLKK
ncbi:MAG: tRNA uridine-5-carboxymethylaminomethyl(34) synthesis enzyme MnmG [Candidatus Borkfalkiaceae bacterium]|nr:tRNA uridine-5-carboxymethylaminomethyl(34) synthesis enzyme MnmG [Christensenellaceae bacterium]